MNNDPNVKKSAFGIHPQALKKAKADSAQVAHRILIPAAQVEAFDLNGNSYITRLPAGLEISSFGTKGYPSSLLKNLKIFSKAEVNSGKFTLPLGEDPYKNTAVLKDFYNEFIKQHAADTHRIYQSIDPGNALGTVSKESLTNTFEKTIGKKLTQAGIKYTNQSTVTVQSGRLKTIADPSLPIAKSQLGSNPTGVLNPRTKIYFKLKRDAQGKAFIALNPRATVNQLKMDFDGDTLEVTVLNHKVRIQVDASEDTLLALNLDEYGLKVERGAEGVTFLTKEFDFYDFQKHPQIKGLVEFVEANTENPLDPARIYKPAHLLATEQGRKELRTTYRDLIQGQKKPLTDARLEEIRARRAATLMEDSIGKVTNRAMVVDQALTARYAYLNNIDPKYTPYIGYNFGFGNAGLDPSIGYRASNLLNQDVENLIKAVTRGKTLDQGTTLLRLPVDPHKTSLILQQGKYVGQETGLLFNAVHSLNYTLDSTQIQNGKIQANFDTRGLIYPLKNPFRVMATGQFVPDLVSQKDLNLTRSRTTYTKLEHTFRQSKLYRKNPQLFEKELKAGQIKYLDLLEQSGLVKVHEFETQTNVWGGKNKWHTFHMVELFDPESPTGYSPLGGGQTEHGYEGVLINRAFGYNLKGKYGPLDAREFLETELARNIPHEEFYAGQRLLGTLSASYAPENLLRNRSLQTQVAEAVNARLGSNLTAFDIKKLIVAKDYSTLKKYVLIADQDKYATNFGHIKKLLKSRIEEVGDKIQFQRDFLGTPQFNQSVYDVMPRRFTAYLHDPTAPAGFIPQGTNDRILLGEALEAAYRHNKHVTLDYVEKVISRDNAKQLVAVRGVLGEPGSLADPKKAADILSQTLDTHKIPVTVALVDVDLDVLARDLYTRAKAQGEKISLASIKRMLKDPEFKSEGTTQVTPRFQKIIDAEARKGYNAFPTSSFFGKLADSTNKLIPGIGQIDYSTEHGPIDIFKTTEDVRGGIPGVLEMLRQDAQSRGTAFNLDSIEYGTLEGTNRRFPLLKGHVHVTHTAEDASAGLLAEGTGLQQARNTQAIESFQRSALQAQMQIQAEFGVQPRTTTAMRNFVEREAHPLIESAIQKELEANASRGFVDIHGNQGVFNALGSLLGYSKATTPEAEAYLNEGLRRVSNSTARSLGNTQGFVKGTEDLLKFLGAEYGETFLSNLTKFLPK